MQLRKTYFKYGFAIYIFVPLRHVTGLICACAQVHLLIVGDLFNQQTPTYYIRNP